MNYRKTLDDSNNKTNGILTNREDKKTIYVDLVFSLITETLFCFKDKNDTSEIRDIFPTYFKTLCNKYIPKIFELSIC